MATIKRYIVGQNQTLWDVALQLGGALEYAVHLLEQNNLPDWQVTPGQLLQYTQAPINPTVANYYAQRNYVLVSVEPTAEPEAPIEIGDFNNDFNNDFNI
jgi:hypothetical protein